MGDMQAVILAAGMGKRLKNLTENNTKCMVQVNGVTLIQRMLRQLDQQDLERIVIVVGYKKDILIEYIHSLEVRTPIEFIENTIYDQTNNIYSLALAKHVLLESDTVLLESDLIFEDSVLTDLIQDPRETLALVDRYESWMDGTVVKISDRDEILDFVPGNKFVFEDIPRYYKTVNIYKFSRHFSATQYVPFLEAYSTALGNNEYYEQVLRVLTLLNNTSIRAKRLNGQKWYEIDDIQDLDIASSIFSDRDDRLKKMQKRYGGYWRYPKILDFCYLVNPYFPPQRLIAEMKANFEKLLTEYPSGAAVNSLLAAKNFSVRKEQIVVGNGAAELIKVLMENRKGNIGFIRPSFEEYTHRVDTEDAVVYVPDHEDFIYGAEDVLEYFQDKDIAMLVLVNPDNPTGNFISKVDVIKMAENLNQRGILLLVDESFVDFAEDPQASLISEEILDANKNLIVIKSISKSYGVPGLRLGIAVSSDESIIRLLSEEVSIWNINSFAEFYMQIEEKYKPDYERALIRFREVRKRFVKELKGISFITPLPSEANYIMCRLTEGWSATELTVRLLVDHDIFIKDLSSKIPAGDCVRIAVRTEEDNERLVSVLRSLEKE